MKLGEFITKFSHNNIIRLIHKIKEGHTPVLESWNDTSMDWEVNKAKGKNRHYINNEVLGVISISFRSGDGIHHSEAINIVIEKLDNQPFIEEVIEERGIMHESCDK